VLGVGATDGAADEEFFFFFFSAGFGLAPSVGAIAPAGEPELA
jgi:hypothetical protein